MTQLYSYRAERSGGITDADLLPCPFCGGKAAISHSPGIRHREADISGVWGINCTTCGGAMPNCFSLKPIADAWNKRPSAKNAAPQVSPKAQVEGSGATSPPSAVAASTGPNDSLDAARYRFLRNTPPWKSPVAIIISDNVGDDIAMLAHEGLDFIIDQAISGATHSQPKG